MITFSGLGSGLDSGAIIDQLVAAEKSRQGPLTTQKLALGRQKIIVNDLATKLSALATKAKEFALPADARAFTASSSDATRVGVAVSGSAQPGTYAMRVNSLARAETTVSRTFTSSAAGVLGTGSVTLAAGADTPVTVNYSATDSLADIAARINNSGARATASVLHDGATYSLMVNSRDAGTSGALAFTDGGDSLDLGNAANVKVIASNAEVEINGVTLTRSSNVLSDVLDGVTLTLSKVTAPTDADTTVTVAADADGVRKKVQGLLDSYNAVADVVDNQLRYDGATKGQDTLFGDSMLRGLQLKMSTLMTSERAHGAGTTSLGRLGIKIDTHGKMAIDATKFDAALKADPNALADLLLGSGETGLAATLATTAAEYTRSSDGILAGKSSSIEQRIKGYDKQIESIEKVATSLATSLQAQFSALEKAMSTLRSQQQYLSSFF